MSQYLGKTCPGDIHNPAYPGKFVTSINRIPLWLLILASVLHVARKLEKWRRHDLMLAIAGASLSMGLTRE